MVLKFSFFYKAMIFGKIKSKDENARVDFFRRAQKKEVYASVKSFSWLRRQQSGIYYKQKSVASHFR